MVNKTKIEIALQKFSELSEEMQQKVIDELKILRGKIAEREFFQDLPKTKSPSPDFNVWKYTISELKSIKGLYCWKDACLHFGLDPTGKSGRRLLKRWAKIHRPEWPEIPEPMKLENNYAAY